MEAHKRSHDKRDLISNGGLIVFEGIDGSGKTTQIDMLGERLTEENIPYRVVREPGSTDLSEKLRGILLDCKKDEDKKIGDRAECLLFLAARAQLVEDVIKPALERKELILCDRFSDSTIAYQGYGREIPLIEIHKAERLALNGIAPDLRILINIDIATSKGRIAKGRASRNRMERVDDKFRERVRQGYINTARYGQSLWVIIDGNKSKEEVAEQIYNYIELF